MGGPTSDDDPTRPAAGPGGWGQGGPYSPPPSSSPPGAYPPGQGGYPPPAAPGSPVPQYPPGPYAPQGTQGPYGSGGPPPDAPRGHRGLVIALVVGLVILLGLGVALVYAFTRDSGDTVSAGRGPGGSSDSVPASGSGPSPATGSDRTDELLAAVPRDFPDCAATDLAGDGDVAAVDCGASTTQPGPSSATFYLYDDIATLDHVFAEDAQELDPMPEGQDCSTAEGVTAWKSGGVEGGEIACTVTGDGPVIAWTDREFGIEGVVTAPGSTQADLAGLADWWRGNSDFRR